MSRAVEFRLHSVLSASFPARFSFAGNWCFELGEIRLGFWHHFHKAAATHARDQALRFLLKVAGAIWKIHGPLLIRPLVAQQNAKYVDGVGCVDGFENDAIAAR
jgi:hypothetical protein